MEASRKTSANFTESHRTVSGPSATQEYHEYRSYSNGGNGPASDYKIENVMPAGASYGDGSKQSYTSYKVQSSQSQYSSSRDKSGERPASQLKQNIHELDSLLQDLNNTSKITDVGPGGSRHYPGNISSDDYSFIGSHNSHLNKKTTTGYNQYNSGPTTDYGSRKPPSPLPRRNSQNMTPSRQSPLSSPKAVRKLSPSPIPGGKIVTASYNYSSDTTKTTTGSYIPQHPGNGYTSDPNNGYPSNGHPNNGYPSNGQPPIKGVPYPSTDYPTNGLLCPPANQPTYQTSRQPSYPSYSSNPHQPDMYLSDAPPTDVTPPGVSYYTKYHSTHSHPSQTPAPVVFPGNTTPRLGGRTQAPPKRVDDLMTELSEFDSTIQHTGFVEPADNGPRPSYRDPSPGPEDFGRYPSPQRHPRQESTPGPAVNYPPGGRNNSMQSGNPHGGPGQIAITHTTTLEESGKGKGKSKYMAKQKGRYQESSSEGGKSGAAVIPICLPFGCAAPCSIM